MLPYKTPNKKKSSAKKKPKKPSFKMRQTGNNNPQYVNNLENPHVYPTPRYFEDIPGVSRTRLVGATSISEYQRLQTLVDQIQAQLNALVVQVDAIQICIDDLKDWKDNVVDPTLADHEARLIAGGL